MRVPLAALAIAVTLGAAAGARQVFRTSTDMVLLSVTAIDAAGHPAANLQQSDFRVLEDGVPQTIVAFSKDPQPIALSLLIDSSTSMESKLAVATQAAIGFCQRLGPNDVAQVIAFNNDTQILQPFTHDLPALEGAIRQVRASGATSLYTAVYVALNELRRIKAASADAIRRQGLVVLSDGEDNASVLSDEDVLDLAKRSTVAIYAVGLRERRKKDEPPRGTQSDYVLRNLSQTTGGRVFFVDDPAQLPAIYTQIADELASQYTVGYVSANTRRDGAWRQIAVRVAQSGVSTRTKLGYYGPGSATER